MKPARPLAVGLLAVATLVLTGCSAYPDGLVVRRADRYFARSHCPSGSAPQVVSVKVWELPKNPDGSDDGRLIWAAQARDEAVTEIRLFSPADGVVVTADAGREPPTGRAVRVEVNSMHAAWGGADFVVGELEPGQAIDVTGEIVAEQEVPAPPLFSDACGGLRQQLATALVGVGGVAVLILGMVVPLGLAVLIMLGLAWARRSRRR